MIDLDAKIIHRAFWGILNLKQHFRCGALFPLNCPLTRQWDLLFPSCQKTGQWENSGKWGLSRSLSNKHFSENHVEVLQIVCVCVYVCVHIFSGGKYMHAYLHTYVPKTHIHTHFLQNYLEFNFMYVYSLCMCRCICVCMYVYQESYKKLLASILNLFHIRITVFYTIMNTSILFAQMW